MSRNPRPKRRVPWRWGVVLCMLAVTFTLGYVGFYKLEVTHSAPNVIYRSLQLFTLESGDIPGAINWQLQIARFLAPVSAAYALVITILDLFHDRVKRVFIAWRGRHVVVCGLGRKGERLIEQLRQTGRQVVVVEPNEHNLHLRRCKELGCVIVAGRADDPWSLQQASLANADVLIAVAGGDGVNIETAVRAHELAQTRKGRHLRCIAHIADPDLRSIFSQHHIFTDEDDPFDLEFFNAFEVGARIMLSQSQLFDPLRMPKSGAPHLLIVGLGFLGEAVLRRAVKDWYVDHPQGESKLRVTIVDIDAANREHWLQLRFPEFIDLCDYRFVEVDMQTFNQSTLESAEEYLDDIAVAMVCLDDDAKAIYAGLTLRNLLPEATSIVVRASEEAGLATLLTAGTESAPVIRGVTAVGLMDIACTLALVLDGTRETLAQAIHQGYVRDQLASGVDHEDNPTMLPWHRLTEGIRQSNRQQADDIRNKLEQIGCKVVRENRVIAKPFEFAAEEVELLARQEHERWLTERKSAGWTWGPSKDLQQKTNPSLVPWANLPDQTRGYNLETVRRIPKILAKADLAICRSGAEEEPQVPRRRTDFSHGKQAPSRNGKSQQPRRISRAS